MRLFSEEVKITSSNSPRNILQVKDFQEVFFGVFEVQINENKYVAEKISEENGNPIVSVVVENGDNTARYPFLLLKGKQEIYFNSESEPVEIFESNITIEEEVEDEEIVEIVEQSFDNIEIIEDKKQEIIEEIKRVKRDAIKKSMEILEQNESRKIQNIKNESKKKEKALAKYLESARENLVDEFTNISEKIKKELIFNNDDKLDEIRESVDLKIKDIADNLNESLKKNFQNSSKLIDKSVKQLVKELYESNINPKVDNELKNIAEEIVDKVSEIDKNLNNKLNQKADVSLIEGVNKELDAIRDANIELNNSLNKGVQKALSRVGNIDKRIVEISEKFDKKITDTEQEIAQYFDEKLSLVKEETLDITDEARKYFFNLIEESRSNLLSEIRKIKDEKPVEYILESKKGEPIVKDWDSIEKDWNKKIHDKFENYKTDLRKYIAVYASGGGTNATQYQDGGTMNGNLTVTGAISASSYLGLVIPNPDLSRYLPLSGGTITGNLSVVGSVSSSGAMIASNYNPGTNVAAFLQTPTSNNLRAALSDETGTGANVFADNATLTSPTLLGQIFAPNQNVTSSTSVVTRGYLDSTFGEFTRIVATTDDTISHPTQRNPDFVLSANLAANTTYLINVVFYFTGTSTNPFGQLLGTFNLADYTLVHYRTSSYISASVVLGTTPFQSFGACNGMTNGRQGVRYEGTITPATSGRLTLGWGPTTAGNTLTRKAGSYIEITKLY